MNYTDELNEKLREKCCVGETVAVVNLLRNGADINSQNKMNGWTCLHWAAKRGHSSLAKILTNNGADVIIKNFKGETAYDIAVNNELKTILSNKKKESTSPTNHEEERDVAINTGAETLCNSMFKPISNSTNKFIPNYLTNPIFPYNGRENNVFKPQAMYDYPVSDSENKEASNPISDIMKDLEIVLKVRNGSSDEKDFIEIELNKNDLTFASLLQISCKELDLSADHVKKIRKLPNTIVRKDKDVKRLNDFQEIELIMI